MIEIVNVNKQWGIGKGGDLLVNIPGDMKFFRETTAGAVVIMGSNTLDSFPGKAPLKNRVNIVMIDSDDKIRPEALAALAADRDAGKTTDLIYVRSLPEAVELGRRYEEEGRQVFVIGGATVYRIMLPYCDTCLVTINDSPLEADVFYPDLESSGQWQQIRESALETWNGVTYKFTTWKRIEQA